MNLLSVLRIKTRELLSIGEPPCMSIRLGRCLEDTSKRHFVSKPSPVVALRGRHDGSRSGSQPSKRSST